MDALNWSKVTVKTLLLQKISISQINAVTKFLSSTTVFNIDDYKKYFLSCKSAYYNDF